MKINELKKGANTISLMVKEVEIRICSNGKKNYSKFSLTDGTNDITANAWSEVKDVKAGDIVELQIDVGEYQGNPSYTIKNYTILPTGAYNIADFIKKAPLDSNKMYNDLLTVINKIEDSDYKKLVNTIYKKQKDNLLKWSAAKTIHHNTIGGLLYHTYRMSASAIKMSQIYHTLNKDVVLIGVLLHDIGKLEELIVDDMGNTDYTISGDLLGHIYIGARIVEETGKELNIPTEKIRNIVHIILSHHGTPEMGSSIVPHTMEAMVVHELDMIDSRIYQYEQITKDLKSGEISSSAIYTLNNVHIYKC